MNNGRRTGNHLSFSTDVVHVLATNAAQKRLKSYDRGQTDILTHQEVNAMRNVGGSHGWCVKTAKELGWASAALHGTAGSVDLAKVEPLINELRGKLATYHPSDVYSCHEAGLFYNLLPNRKYVLKSEKKKVRGTKAMKEKTRITLYGRTDADGSDKIPFVYHWKQK